VGEYSKESRAKDDYCVACKFSRKIKKDEYDAKCDTCSKDIKVVEKDDNNNKSKSKVLGRIHQ
jgi:hypothetical protein